MELSAVVFLDSMGRLQAIMLVLQLANAALIPKPISPIASSTLTPNGLPVQYFNPA